MDGTSHAPLSRVKGDSLLGSGKKGDYPEQSLQGDSTDTSNHDQNAKDSSSHTRIAFGEYPMPINSKLAFSRFKKSRKHKTKPSPTDRGAVLVDQLNTGKMIHEPLRSSTCVKSNLRTVKAMRKIYTIVTNGPLHPTNEMDIPNQNQPSNNVEINEGVGYLTRYNQTLSLETP